MTTCQLDVAVINSKGSLIVESQKWLLVGVQRLWLKEKGEPFLRKKEKKRKRKNTFFIVFKHSVDKVAMDSKTKE